MRQPTIRRVLLPAGAVMSLCLLSACGSEDSGAAKTVTQSVTVSSTASSTSSTTAPVAPAAPSASATVNPNNFVTHADGQVDGLPTATVGVVAPSSAASPALIPQGGIHQPPCGTRTDFLTFTDSVGSKVCFASAGTARIGVAATSISTGNNAGTLYFADGARQTFQPWTVVRVGEGVPRTVAYAVING